MDKSMLSVFLTQMRVQKSETMGVYVYIYTHTYSYLVIIAIIRV